MDWVMHVAYEYARRVAHLALVDIRDDRLLTVDSYTLSPQASSAAIVSFFETLRVEVQVSTIPVGTVRGCAKAMVNGVCKGERYLTEPAWFRVTGHLFLEGVFPEVIEWSYRLMHIRGLGVHTGKYPSKKILDLLGVKNIIYPSTIDNLEIKTD
nr:11-beta-hydroxysteroid dehydrogenase 1a [Quercus suber]